MRLDRSYKVFIIIVLDCAGLQDFWSKAPSQANMKKVDGRRVSKLDPLDFFPY
jgi:hypothetical protein